MDFRPLNDTERRQLINALRGNAESDRAILMDRRDTSFLGTADEVTDEEVIWLSNRSRATTKPSCQLSAISYQLPNNPSSAPGGRICGGS
jgi:hypothetical protein